MKFKTLTIADDHIDYINQVLRHISLAMPTQPINFNNDNNVSCVAKSLAKSFSLCDNLNYNILVDFSDNTVKSFKSDGIESMINMFIETYRKFIIKPLRNRYIDIFNIKDINNCLFYESFDNMASTLEISFNTVNKDIDTFYNLNLSMFYPIYLLGNLIKNNTNLPPNTIYEITNVNSSNNRHFRIIPSFSYNDITTTGYISINDKLLGLPNTVLESIFNNNVGTIIDKTLKFRVPVINAVKTDKNELYILNDSVISNNVSTSVTYTKAYTLYDVFKLLFNKYSYDFSDREISRLKGYKLENKILDNSVFDFNKLITEISFIMDAPYLIRGKREILLIK